MNITRLFCHLGDSQSLEALFWVSDRLIFNYQSLVDCEYLVKEDRRNVIIDYLLFLN